MNAKAALAAGDRATTVVLLKKARQLIPACPALQEGTSTTAALLSFREPIDIGSKLADLRPFS
jgi:hypothetical protein